MKLLPNFFPKKGRIPSWSMIAGGSAAVLTAAKVIRELNRPALDLHGKIILITGGSRGLGFAIAQELGKFGGHFALCARDPAELDQACARLKNDGIDATPFVCDLTDIGVSDAEALVTRVREQLGPIDVLVNNAGHITVGALDSFSHLDFERAMNVMFWAPLNLTFAVLPEMRRRHRGDIINITSVGGRVSVPHLLPYSCAKFAFVGFSTGLSTELRHEGVRVLTVVPGLMRTGSYLNAEFKGAAKQEFAWFGLSGNLPGLTVAASYAARCIRKALHRQRRICTISIPAKMLVAFEALMPENTRRALELINTAFLPKWNYRTAAMTGKHLSPQLGRIFQGLTLLGKAAARELNE